MNSQETIKTLLKKLKKVLKLVKIMKVLACADTHGDKSLIKKLAAKAGREKVDLVILAGDFTFGEADLTGIIGPFKIQKKKVLLIPGNHETLASVDFLVNLYGPGIYNLHGYGRIFDGVGFFGCGSGNIGLFQLDDKEVFDTLLYSFKSIKKAKKKIMITHVPPINTKIDDLGWTHGGSAGVRAAILETKPDLCLCGHLHETAGLSDIIGKTKVINVGRNGIIIEI